MRTSQKLTLIALLAICGMVIAGLIMTGGSHAPAVGNQEVTVPAMRKQPPVDEQLLDTARSLTPLASTPLEQQLSQKTVQLADREVDLAFAGALRNASRLAAPQTAAIKALQERIRKSETEVEAAEERVKELTASAANANGSKKDQLQQRLQLAQAELELDKDRLADAKQELSSAGGDPQGDVQLLWQEHEQSHSGNGSAKATPVLTVSSAATPSAGSLIAKWGAWSALRAKRAQLVEALRDAHRVSAALSLAHDKLAQQVSAEPPQKPTDAQQAASLPVVRTPESGAESNQAATAAVAALQHRSLDEKDLADLVRRIQNLNQLIVIYSRWVQLAAAQSLTALHGLFQSVLWIVLIVLAAFLINGLIDHSRGRLGYDKKRVLTLHNVARFTVGLFAGFPILLMIFGPPNNLSTALGLAGAGLTVALKDFILSFCGWFVLMGRNGIRVGDWVEINGVRGEVAEIGLLRTVLFETGNWTEPGHPTGRQVAFLNSFAVEGYYFNFTTSGQWLWDETQFRIPSGLDPYPIIEKTQAIAQKETESDARQAEAEWERVTRRYDVKSFSFTPAVNVRSTEQGVEVVVRYITRASERYKVRSRLNHALLDLIHRRKPSAPVSEALPESTAVRPGETAPDLN